jgi:hypothetical protein
LGRLGCRLSRGAVRVYGGVRSGYTVIKEPVLTARGDGAMDIIGAARVGGAAVALVGR